MQPHNPCNVLPVFNRSLPGLPADFLNEKISYKKKQKRGGPDKGQRDWEFCLWAKALPLS